MTKVHPCCRKCKTCNQYRNLSQESPVNSVWNLVPETLNIHCQSHCFSWFVTKQEIKNFFGKFFFRKKVFGFWQSKTIILWKQEPVPLTYQNQNLCLIFLYWKCFILHGLIIPDLVQQSTHLRHEEHRAIPLVCLGWWWIFHLWRQKRLSCQTRIASCPRRTRWKLA